MHAEIIDRHIPAIRKDLEKLGLTYGALQDDILDHICCMVEEEMDAGGEFYASYNQVMSQIGDTALSGIQHQTLLLLDKKFQRMKKLMYILGLSGSGLTLLGAFFKVMHLPGASIMMMVGFLVIVAVFLPFYFILNYREQTDKPGRIYPIVGYLSLFFIFTAAVFKIMHWPGANVMIQVSLVFLLVGFLPLYIVQIFKRTGGKKVNPGYFVMLLVGISIAVLLFRVNISKYAVDRYTEMTLEYQEASQLLQHGTASLLKLAGDSLISDDIRKITAYSDELVAMADEMLGTMLEKVEQPGVPIDQVNRRDYRKVGRDAFEENDMAEKFKKLSREYQSFLLERLDDPILSSQVRIDLMFSSEEYISGWTPGDHFSDPLVINYCKISSLKQAILHSEYMAVRFLLHRS